MVRFKKKKGRVGSISTAVQ